MAAASSLRPDCLALDGEGALQVLAALVDAGFSVEEVSEGYNAMDTNSAAKAILDARHG